MSRQIEDRLRDAYQAKTAQLTEQRLDQFATAREHGLDDLLVGEHTAELPVLDFDAPPTRKRQHRWIAPALAAAAVAALAIGVTAVTGIEHGSKPTPNPPASRVSSPPPSSSAPTPSPSASSSQPVVAPPYLPAGQTGSRDQVPWSVVGTGWRLLQPDGSSSLYLYDPADGRYLISDSLPGASYLLAWSPDGNRALLRITQPHGYQYQEVDLHAGAVSAGFYVPQSNFVSYTQPRGLAILAQQTVGPREVFLRYGHNGGLESLYPDSVLGSQYVAKALYLPDGAEFVGGTTSGLTALFRNQGAPVRQFPTPADYTGCFPLKWWSSGTFLERCYRSKPQTFLSLYLQPVAGGAPTLLTDDPGAYQLGHLNGWMLRNGDVLLANAKACGPTGYQILESNGTVRPLRMPPGITAPGWITNMDGDVATFAKSESTDCGGPGSVTQLVDYNMVTGQTRTLLDHGATIVSWPDDPS